MFIVSCLYWQYFVCEFTKGVTVVNNSKRTKILQIYIYIYIYIYFTFFVTFL